MSLSLLQVEAKLMAPVSMPDPKSSEALEGVELAQCVCKGFASVCPVRKRLANLLPAASRSSRRGL